MKTIFCLCVLLAAVCVTRTDAEDKEMGQQRGYMYGTGRNKDHPKELKPASDENRSKEQLEASTKSKHPAHDERAANEHHETSKTQANNHSQPLVPMVMHNKPNMDEVLKPNKHPSKIPTVNTRVEADGGKKEICIELEGGAKNCTKSDDDGDRIDSTVLTSISLPGK